MAFKTIHVALTGDSTSLRGALLATAREVDTFGHKVSGVSRSAVSSSQLMAAGFAVAGAAIAGGLAAAVNGAAKFEAAMRNVNSISGLSEAAFKAQGAAVLDLSRQLPQSATTLAEGLYEIASSGFQGAEGLDVLEESAKAASAGLTTTNNSAKAITAVLNAYGRGAEEAADVSDVLFQTVNLGVISFEELTGVIGDTVGSAAAAGVGIDEVGSAIATMTLAGISASEAGTSLNGVFNALLKPSDAMVTVLQSLGYESGLAALEEDGLRGVMVKLQEATGGNVMTLMELFNERRAARGALALLANEGENYRRVSDEITDSEKRQGATQRALNEQMKAVSAQFKLFVNGANAAAIELGTHLLPAVADLLDGLQRLGTNAVPGVQAAMTALAPFFRNVAEIGGDLVEIAKALVDNLSPLGQVIAGIVAAGVIESLNTLSAILAGIAGFLADHEALVTALAVAYGVKLAASVGQAALAFGSLALEKVAVGLYDVAGAAQTTATRMGALNAVSAAGLVGLLTALVLHIQKTNREAEALAAGLRTGLDLRSSQGLRDLADAAARSAEEVDKARKSFGPFSGAARELERGKADKKLEEFAKQAEYAARASINLSENVNTIRHATGLSEKAVEDLAKKLDVDLTQGFNQSAEARKKIIDDFKGVQDGAREAGLQVKDSAGLTKEAIEEMAAAVEAAQKAIDDTAKKVGEVFSSSFDLVSNYAEAAKEHEKATAGVTTAQEKLAAAQKDLALLRERQAAGDKITIADAQALAAAEDKVAEAQKGVAAAQKAVSDTSLSEFFAQQVADANKFATDVRAAAERGLDPAIIKRLLEAGPEQAAPFLQGILSGHVDRNVAMANESQAKLNEVNAQMVEAARVTQRAINATNTEMASEFETAMQILAAKAALGGEATARAIAEKLGIGVGEVSRIARDYVIVLAEGINPLLEGIGAVPVYLDQTEGRTAAGIQMHSGGRVPGGHGGGDIIDARLEPGEFVFSVDAVDRIGARNLEEMHQRARRGYHEGGFVHPEDVPYPPDLSLYGSMVGHAGSMVEKKAYDEVVAYLKAHPPVPEGGGGGGGSPYTGGAIGSGWQQITGYLDSKGQDYQITSTYRPGDPGFHGRGKAVDMVGDMAAIFRTLAAGNPVPGINELFYTPMGYSYDEGARVGWTVPGHYDHVHAATFHEGGIVPGFPGQDRLAVVEAGESISPVPGSERAAEARFAIDYGQLAAALVRAGIGAQPPARIKVDVPLNIDGREFARATGEHIAREFYDMRKRYS